MRLFYAVEIPEDIKYKLAREIEQLEDFPLKLAKSSQYHITLLFLGEVEPRNVKFLEEALSNSHFEKFKISLEGMNIFYDSRGAVKVIYKDITKGRDELRNIHDYLKEICGETLDMNGRNYEPHLTLARGKVRDKEVTTALENKIEVIDAYSKSLEFNVKELLLINSTLSPKGSKYKIISKLLLSQ